MKTNKLSESKNTLIRFFILLEALAILLCLIAGFSIFFYSIYVADFILTIYGIIVIIASHVLVNNFNKKYDDLFKKLPK